MIVYCQSDEIFERLQAIENDGKIWYNIDGCSVMSENYNHEFNNKSIKKVLRKYSLKENTGVLQDSIKFNNLYFVKTESINDSLVQTSSFYIVENLNKKITVVNFNKMGSTDKIMEYRLTNLIIENKIPEENFVLSKPTNINMAGRIIELEKNCYWTYLNTVQCPYFGEMNWSVHKSLESAQESINNQLLLTKSRKGGEVISEEYVDIEFENVPTKAKKVILSTRGLAKAMVGMSGAKELTIFYVAEKVRGKYVSCVMSFWNNDHINIETQLPPLLDKVMKL